MGAADNLTETGSMLLYGFIKQKTESLIPLERSWNSPLKIFNLIDYQLEGYEKGQRSYTIKAEAEEISFTLNASDSSPMVNLCFVIQDCVGKAEVNIHDKMITDGKIVRQGLVRNTIDQLQLVVWINMTSENRTQFTLRKL